jgi:hypothetical protein
MRCSNLGSGSAYRKLAGSPTAALFLLIFLQPLSMIDGFGHGGNGGRRNQDQVEAHCLRSADSHSRGHNFDAAVGKDRPDFGSANAIVNILHYPRSYQMASKKGRVDQTERQRPLELDG